MTRVQPALKMQLCHEMAKAVAARLPGSLCRRGREGHPAGRPTASAARNGPTWPALL